MLKKKGLGGKGFVFFKSEELSVPDSVNPQSCATSEGSLSPTHHWTGTSFNMLSLYVHILYFIYIRDIHICILSHAIF